MPSRGRDNFRRPGRTSLVGPAGTLGRRGALLALLALASSGALAFTVTINQGTRAIYLQVGNGTSTGFFDNGVLPSNNTTINKVSVAVAGTAVGNGTAQAMTTDSTASNSFWDGYAFCNLPAQLYIGGFYRTPGNGNNTLSVTATVPLALTDAAGDTIPFSQISWTSSGNADGNAAQPFPAGTFPAGGTRTIGTIGQNQWAESCWTFSYLNTVIPPGGSYTGRVTYTLVAP
jgi:hypothetical protein